jgi:hypothetical protein
MVASQYVWHRARLEPNGAGKSGTVIRPKVANAVMHRLAGMIVDLVSSLSMHLGGLDYGQWKKDWEAADNLDVLAS